MSQRPSQRPIRREAVRPLRGPDRRGPRHPTAPPAPRARPAWLGELVDAAPSRGLTITLENVEEPLSILAEVFTRIPRMKSCLDIGHASLDGDNERPFQLLSLIRDRLALVHAHDNRQGHGEAGDRPPPFGRGTIQHETILRTVRGNGVEGHATLELFSGTKDEKAESAR